MPNQRVRLWVTLAILSLACGIAVADNSKVDPATDAELLEFLGSVDSGADSQAAADDGSWIDYLSRTDIAKVPKAAEPGAAPPKQAAGKQPPASGDKND